MAPPPSSRFPSSWFPEAWAAMDVALCHDWLTGMRGGERVLEIIAQGFPWAKIHTLIADRDSVSEAIGSHDIITSRLQNVPGIFKNYRYFLPTFPRALKSLPPATSEVLISTSHCIAKSLPSSPQTQHLCYCFTPMRYAWTFYDEYFGRNPVKAILAKPLLARLRRWDAHTAKRVDRFVAISDHVRKRIHRFYGREADIVYPPVDTDRCIPGPTGKGSYDLVVSALVPYKRVDLAVRAYRELDQPLKVVGTGSAQPALAALAGPKTEFLGWKSDPEVLELYQSCRFLIFPGEEDFGIVPLEAQACGKPVVAFGRGGALETVVDGVSGVFFDAQTQEALSEAVSRAAAATWDPGSIREHALRFGVRPFIEGLNVSLQRLK